LCQRCNFKKHKFSCQPDLSRASLLPGQKIRLLFASNCTCARSLFSTAYKMFFSCNSLSTLKNSRKRLKSKKLPRGKSTKLKVTYLILLFLFWLSLTYKALFKAYCVLRYSFCYLILTCSRNHHLHVSWFYYQLHLFIQVIIQLKCWRSHFNLSIQPTRNKINLISFSFRPLRKAKQKTNLLI